MKQEKALELIQQVRTGYAAMARECHMLRHKVRPFDLKKLPLIQAMDDAINDLSGGPVAQRSEQGLHKSSVLGSNPSRPTKHPKTERCGYEANIDLPYPVMWNPFNKVVQCHNCGQVWHPK